MAWQKTIGGKEMGQRRSPTLDVEQRAGLRVDFPLQLGVSMPPGEIGYAQQRSGQQRSEPLRVLPASRQWRPARIRASRCETW
jgi:hypothetical protein